jgi:hypothetical protein
LRAIQERVSPGGRAVVNISGRAPHTWTCSTRATTASSDGASSRNGLPVGPSCHRATRPSLPLGGRAEFSTVIAEKSSCVTRCRERFSFASSSRSRRSPGRSAAQEERGLIPPIMGRRFAS